MTLRLTPEQHADLLGRFRRIERARLRPSPTPERAFDFGTKREDAEEGDLQSKVEGALKAAGYEVFHDRSRGVNPPGFPDVVAASLARGRMIVAELKTRTKLKAAQERWLRAFAAAGVETYVWQMRDWKSGEISRVIGGALPGVEGR